MSNIDIEILYKDDDLLVINKPAGLLVHPAPTKHKGDQATIIDWLVKNFPEVQVVGDDPAVRPGIVHRLDKDTSGVMIIARNQDSFDYLKNLFQTRQITKTYLALVHGHIKQRSGTIDKPLGIVGGTTKRSTRSQKMSKTAVTDYKVVKYLGPKSDGTEQGSKTPKDSNGQFTLVSVTPRTGRTHQIRVHLISIGHPIVGDKLYGRRDIKGIERQFLHAESIEFTTPGGSRLKIGADLPEDLKTFLDSI
ncbi:MAG: RluA family pseudouridine synthase [bacterium]|nr:RluA family pseudouridine synthase [bacterium]